MVDPVANNTGSINLTHNIIANLKPCAGQYQVSDARVTGLIIRVQPNECKTSVSQAGLGPAANQYAETKKW